MYINVKTTSNHFINQKFPYKYQECLLGMALPLLSSIALDNRKNNHIVGAW